MPARKSAKKATKKKATKKKNLPARRAAPAGASVVGYEEDADAGFEGMTQADFVIPFLGVLQPLSPQVGKKEASYIKGAEAGMAFNTATGELFPAEDEAEGVVVIPCHRSHYYIEWIPRNQGGGLVNVYEPHDPFVIAAKDGQPAFGKIVLESKNELVEVFSVFVLIDKGDGLFDQAIISFSSSQIKAYKQWMTRASNLLVKLEDGRNIRPPLWSHRYRINTVFRTNDQGSWYGWTINFADGDAAASRLPADDEYYIAARAFRNAAMTFAKDAVSRQAQAEDDAGDGVM